MTARETWERYSSLGGYLPHEEAIIEVADAAIAELQAENARLLTLLTDRPTTLSAWDCAVLERAEKAEARCKELAEERADGIGELLKAEAELAALKVCIICDHCSGVDDSRWCDEEKPWDESVWLYDNCHYTPSRWAARAEEWSG